MEFLSTGEKVRRTIQIILQAKFWRTGNYHYVVPQLLIKKTHHKTKYLSYQDNYSDFT